MRDQIRFNLKLVYNGRTGTKVSDFLAERSGISRSAVKDAMSKGALWIKRGKGAMRRLRRATALMQRGDFIEFCYDRDILSIKPPDARCLYDRGRYSVWYKPAGLMSQGTRYGDHCSLMRQAEFHFEPKREVFLVHRLDRESSGVMLLAHSREAAAQLSGLFRSNQIIKTYCAEILGNPGKTLTKGRIDLALDGKEALTEYEVVSYDARQNRSVILVNIKTGRLHQIRRHFDMIGFPVIGDPKYGKGNKNSEGMRLKAVSLTFRCPFDNRDVVFNLPESYVHR